MSNQEILTKAIEKAVAGGWVDHPFAICTGCAFHEVKSAWTPGEDWDGMTLGNPSSFIYNHDFAKALWGEEDCFIYVEYTSENIDAITTYPQGSIHMPLYQFHLQQMVIADDPLKYLGANL